MPKVERIVFAVNAGTEVATAIPALREKHRADVVALALDFGQGGLAHARDEAFAAGALRAHVIDIRDSFARDYLMPALKSGALGEGSTTCVALSQPLIAERLVEIAKLEGADAVAYGCARGDKHGVRIVRSIRALEPRLQVVTSEKRTDEAVESKAEESEERNPAVAGVRDITACVALTFDQGTPVEVNGISMPLVDLIESLTTHAVVHGVGRLSGAGPSSWFSLLEAPALVVLDTAHRALITQIASRDVLRFRRQVSARYADVINGGRWFSPMRRGLDAFINSVHEQVSGTVILTLGSGHCQANDVSSPHAAPGAVRFSANEVRVPPELLADRSAAERRESFVVVR